MISLNVRRDSLITLWYVRRTWEQHTHLCDVTRWSYIAYTECGQHYQNSPVFYKKNPTFCQKKALNSMKRALHTIHRALHSIKRERLFDTGWRRPIGSPKLQIIFHKRATKYRSLLWKMTSKDKGSYESSPPCNIAYTDSDCQINVVLCVWCYSLISQSDLRFDLLITYS